MKALLSSLVLLAVPAIAADAPDDLDWRAAKHEEMAGKRLAVLKTDGAVYLRRGEKAAVILTPDGGARLVAGSPAEAAMTVTYDGRKAMLVRDGAAFDLLAYLGDADRYPISDRLDLAGGLTEVAPGEDGLRLMTFDQERPEAAAFDGLEWFAYDASMRFDVEFRPEKKMTAHDIETERGLMKRFWLAGRAEVSIEGQVVEFPFYASTPEKSDVKYLFTSFTDATTGNETYGVGRYIELVDFGAFPPKTVTLDFNRAYNPYCARSPHYNCPRALIDLPVAVRAGERAPAD